MISLGAFVTKYTFNIMSNLSNNSNNSTSNGGHSNSNAEGSTLERVDRGR